MVKTANEIFRDWETDGVPASGVHKPIKTDIRDWGTFLESAASDLTTAVDPIARLCAGDGVTNDSAAFAAINAMFPNDVFDLKGQTYLVSAIPNGKYRNGKWRVPLAGEGGGTIDYIVRDTLLTDTRKIAWGFDRLSNWPQDKACTYNNVLYVAWMEGSDHVGADVHIRIARSYDNGQTWTDFERYFQSATGARGSFAMGVCQGRLVLFVREHTGDFSDANITANRLYSRRCGERREKKVNAITGIDATTMSIVATNGSATIRVANMAKHGCLVGDQILINNVVGTVGGRTISGTYTIAAVGTDYVEFTHPSGAATSDETNTSDFVVNFIEGAFVEQTIGGASFHTAVKGLSGSLYASTDQWYVHSFAEDPTDTSGAFLVGVTGGGIGPHCAKITGMISGTRTLAQLAQINSNSARGEPTIKRASDGTLIGFLRADSSSLVGGLILSADGGATWTTRLNISGVANDFRYSPIPLVIADDKIYAVATGNRLRAESGTGSEGDVPVYLLEGDVASIKTNGWAALSVTQFQTVRFANESYADTGNGVGVGSLVYNNGVLSVFLATENADNVGTVLGAPDIICTRIILDEAAYQLDDAYSPQSRHVTHQGEASLLSAGIFRGMGAYHFVGKVYGDGSIAWGKGFTVTHASTGVYNIAFNNVMPTSQYHVSVMSDGSSVGAYFVTNKTTSGFTITCRNVTGTNSPVADGAFTFTVDINYQFTRSNWDGVF